MAVPHRTKDRGVDFISCVAWDKTADFMQKYLHKGSQICISGRIQTGQYDDADGKRIYTTDVLVEEIDFADAKKESNANQEVINNTSTISQQVTDDDLPF